MGTAWSSARWAFTGAFTVACTAASVTGCDGASTSGAASAAAPEASPSPSAAPAPTVSVGAEIVAAVTPITFSQGTVVAVEGDDVTFELGRADRETGERARKKVAAIDAHRIGEDAPVTAGEHLVCNVAPAGPPPAPSPAWYPCRVTEVAGTTVRVIDHYGDRHELTAPRWVKPRPELQKALAAFIETELAHRAFDRAFEAAGTPHRPPGWRPVVGAEVVIHFVGTSFYGGKVVEVFPDKGKVRVDFAGDRWSDRDVPSAAVAPVPETELAVDVGQFALVRPAAADERWEPHKVTGVGGAGVQTVDRDGAAHEVPRRDLLPMVPVPAPKP